MRADSSTELQKLRVDGGVTNSDHAMQIQADLGGFIVERPEMRESTALGSALLAGSALKLFGWDLTRPETLRKVNARQMATFEPRLGEGERQRKWKGWLKAVERSKKWREEEEQDEAEERLEKTDQKVPRVNGEEKDFVPTREDSSGNLSVKGKKGESSGTTTPLSMNGFAGEL